MFFHSHPLFNFKDQQLSVEECEVPTFSQILTNGIGSRFRFDWLGGVCLQVHVWPGYRGDDSAVFSDVRSVSRGCGDLQQAIWIQWSRMQGKSRYCCGVVKVSLPKTSVQSRSGHFFKIYMWQCFQQVTLKVTHIDLFSSSGCELKKNDKVQVGLLRLFIFSHFDINKKFKF